MPTTLCFDFGNTRKKCAVFDNTTLKEVITIDNDSPETIQSLIDQHHPSKSILSSVIDHNLAIEEVLASKTKFHKLSHLSKIPITTPVSRPQTIGADRLALSAAAIHLYPQKNNYAQIVFVILFTARFGGCPKETDNLRRYLQERNFSWRKCKSRFRST